MSESQDWTGGCLCGELRWRAEGEPHDAQFCHCRMCRRASGSAFAVWASFPRERFRFIRGTPRLYRSSAYAERGFCPTCGTPLTFEYLEGEGGVAVAIGSFDAAEGVRPRVHWGVESKLPWLVFADGLPQKRTDEDPEVPAALRAPDKGTNRGS